MSEKKKQYLSHCVDTSTIFLVESYDWKNGLSPEDAFTLLTYYDYAVKEEEHDAIMGIINNTEDYEGISEYGYCFVIDEKYLEEKGLEKCLDELYEKYEAEGNFRDYILVRRRGRLNLIHHSIDIESLKNNPFIASKERLEDGGGSFSLGLYVLDHTHNRHLENEPGWYTGVYKGCYYECIEDLCNGEKCGSENIAQKEYFIPRGVETIKWN